MNALAKYKKDYFPTVNSVIDPNGIVYNAKPRFSRMKINSIKSGIRTSDTEIDGKTYRFEEYSPCLRLWGRTYPVFYCRIKEKGE